MIKVYICPVCSNNSFSSILKARDNLVSKKYYDIIECKKCTLRLTNNIPDENSILRYYESKNYTPHRQTSKGIIDHLYALGQKYMLKKKLNLVRLLSNQHGNKWFWYFCGVRRRRSPDPGTGVWGGHVLRNLGGRC